MFQIHQNLMNYYHFKCFVFFLISLGFSTSINAQDWIEKKVRNEDYSKIYVKGVISDSTQYYYNEENLIIAKQSFHFTDGIPSLSHEITYSYPSKNIRITNESSSTQTTHTWLNGDTLASIEYLWSYPGSPPSGNLFEFKFFENNNTKTRIKTHSLLGTNSWNPYMETIHVENLDGYEILSSSIEWIGGVSRTLWEHACEYDELNRLIYAHGTESDGSDYEIIYEYNEEGYKIKDEYWVNGSLVKSMIDFDLESLTFTYRRSGSYVIEVFDNRNNKIYKTKLKELNGEFYFRSIYSYDENDQLIKIQTDRKFADGLIYTNFQTYQYDRNNNLIYRELVDEYGKIAHYQKWNYDIYNNLLSTENLDNGVIVEPTGHYVQHHYITKYKSPKLLTNLTSKDETFVLFPNPTEDHINIHILSEDQIGSDMKLFDSNGKTLFDVKLMSEQNRVVLPKLIPGIYVVGLIKDNKQYLKKLMIKNE